MSEAAVRMSHVGLAVSDLESSLRFYTEGLGFELGPRFEAGDDVAAVSEVEPPTQSVSQYLTKDGFRLELLGWEKPGVQGHPSTARNQVGLTHLCFEVDTLPSKILRGNGTLLKVLRIAGRDVQSDFIGQLLEIVGTRNEVRLAVDLDEGAKRAIGMNIALHQSLLCLAGRIFRAAHALLF